MARRLVRHQAALSLVAIVLAACSKKTTPPPPTASAGGLEPVELELSPPTKADNGTLTFELRPAAADAPCPRLPEAASVSLNGVRGTVRSFGGPPDAKGADPKCKLVDVSFPPAEPGESKLVIDDGTTKLDVAIPFALPFRLITPTLHTTGAMATFVFEAGALEGSMKEIEASYTPEGGAKSSIPKSAIRIAGKRILVTLPAKDLKPGPYHFDAKMKFATTPTMTPARNTSTKAYVSMTQSFPFTVAP